MDSLHDVKTDVFISFKNTDFAGNKTRDGEIARELYEELTSRKVATFYSSATLLSLGQAVYKKSIDEALESTKVLIVVSTDHRYLETEWVKYEWEGFHQDILSGMKKHAQIVPYFASFSREETPRSFRDLQTFNIDQSSIQEVADFVVNSLINIQAQSMPHSSSMGQGFEIKNSLNLKKVRSSLYTSDSDSEYARLKVQSKNTHWCDMAVLNKVIAEIDRSPLWILDIGCAYNYVGNLRFGNMPNVRVLGIDISERCLEFAEKTSDSQKFVFRKVDLEDGMMEEHLQEIMFELGIEKFDIMFGALLLLHLKKPVTVLKKLRKFLAKDGYIIVRGSDDGSVIALNDDGLVRKIIDKCNNTVGFSDRQNGRKLYNQLISAGYKDVKVETFLKDSSGKDVDERDELFFERFSYRINYFNKILKADPSNEQKRNDYLFMKYALEELEEVFSNQDFWYCEHDFIAYGKK